MNRRAWTASALALILGVLAIRFGFHFPWARTLDILADSDWGLLTAAGVLNIISLVAKAAAWHLLVRRTAPVRLTTAQTATFLGAAVSSISVSVSGEVVRAQFAATRTGVPFGATAAALLASRVVEAIGLLVFLALAFALLPPWPGAGLIELALLAVTAGVVLGYHLVPWSRMHSRALGRWHETFVHVAASKDRLGLAGAVAFATCSWIAQWFTYHWSIAATHVTVTPAVSLMALIVANVAGIPRLTPANIGVMQGSIMVGMRAFRIHPAASLAAGLALQAVQVLPVLAIGMAIAGRHGFRRLVSQRSEAV